MDRQARSFDCPKCGAATVGGDHCPECGDPLTIECTQCGIKWKLWSGTKLCPHCGAETRGRSMKAPDAGKIAGR